MTHGHLRYVLAILIGLCLGGCLRATGRSVSAEVVAWQTGDGIARLERAQQKVDFFSLAPHFESQSNKTYCGPATVTIVLNALKGRRQNGRVSADLSLLPAGASEDVDSARLLFRRYTQRNVLDGAAKSDLQVIGLRSIVEDSDVRDPGMQLRELQQLFIHHGVHAAIYPVGQDAALATVRAALAANLGRPGDFVVVNYHRDKLGQQGGGHFSPLGAYDRTTDSFLIMDVNPNKADWTWVAAPRLFAAMQTFDTKENRGYLLISDAK